MKTSKIITGAIPVAIVAICIVVSLIAGASWLMGGLIGIAICLIYGMVIFFIGRLPDNSHKGNDWFVPIICIGLAASLMSGIGGQGTVYKVVDKLVIEHVGTADIQDADTVNIKQAVNVLFDQAQIQQVTFDQCNIGTFDINSIVVNNPENVEINDPENVEINEPENVEINDPENVEINDPENVEINDPENVEINNPENVEINEPEVHECTWGAWQSNATEHWRECTDKECDNFESDKHTFGAWSVTKAATETSTGLKVRTCKVCQYEQSETIAKLTHSHKPSSWKSDKDGHWKTCLNGCDEKLEAASHTYGAWSVTKAATETSTGLKVRTCKVCQYEQSETIAKLTHSHKTSSWKFDKDGHWKTCTGCNEKLEAASHTYGAWVITTPATETATGSKTRSCTVCSYKQTETIPMKEHVCKFSTTWESDDFEHWHECSCGKKNDIAPHHFYEPVYVVMPTTTSTGKLTRECMVCGKVVTETVPKLESEEVKVIKVSRQDYGGADAYAKQTVISATITFENATSKDVDDIQFILVGVDGSKTELVWEYQYSPFNGTGFCRNTYNIHLPSEIGTGYFLIEMIKPGYDWEIVSESEWVIQITE